MAGKEKEPKAPKAPKASKADKAAKGKGNGLLAVWTLAHGVIMGGLFWLAWLAVVRSPGEDMMHVAGPYAAVAGAVFFILILNIADAMQRGAAAEA